MTEPRVAIVDDARFDEHRPRGHHPERPERLEAARAGLRSAIPEARRLAISPEAATEHDLAAIHSPRYLRTLGDTVGHGWGHLDADTYWSPGTWEAALHAAGGAMDMARALVRGDADSGFALLRPPGHHATADRAMGFCMINHVAAAAHAALAAGTERVAIVDWDVHHGNGTQAIFEDDPRVLFVSTHQWPFYPGTGAPDEVGVARGAGYTANVALPAGSGPEAHGEAWRRVVLPLLDAFGPGLVLVSSGFDGHARDPLAGHELDADSYAAMASALLRFAERRGDLPIGVLLEGGYDLQAIEDSVRGVGAAMGGVRMELPESAPGQRFRQAVDATLAALRPHWPDLEERAERLAQR